MREEETDVLQTLRGVIDLSHWHGLPNLRYRFDIAIDPIKPMHRIKKHLL